MAENPQRPQRARPLSPHLTIYRWPVAMATSITHRATGIALSAGTVLLAWWLVAAASGPEAYAAFAAAADSIPGRIVLFGLVWSLAYHLLSGIRHLAWDLGYGFELRTAEAMSWAIILGSVALAAAVFALALAGQGGFNA
ncbi:MAG: succinate dehydrogenase, cytochrome b556 subunit [Alphaproteobacteria bacterium]|nr:succinate dehydrogenase, cytochrome b556 subunit [Alphaproteobacteria bacterium]MBV9695123.1 succinate dehydrogenase, cytochrome b556 subunit [Alphaproteobacteria bacterium]